MFLLHEEGLNIEKLLNKIKEYFEILIKLKTNLRVTYKDRDYFDISSEK